MNNVFDKTMIEITTSSYIEQLLSPGKVWPEGISRPDKWKLVFDSVVNHERIKAYILQMEYRDFLETLYWKTISSRVKSEAKYRCRLCGHKSENGLRIHHSNYKEHGLEHLLWKDILLCLCNECHEKIHTISKKTKERVEVIS